MLDPERRAVQRGGRPVALSAKEFALLRLLMENAGAVVSRARILSEVWGYGFDPGTNVVDVYVLYLRRKLDRAGEPSRIETVRGAGYRLQA